MLLSSLITRLPLDPTDCWHFLYHGACLACSSFSDLPHPSRSRPKHPPRSCNMTSTLPVFCAEDVVPPSRHWGHAHAGPSSPRLTMSSLSMESHPLPQCHIQHQAPPTPLWHRTGFFGRTEYFVRGVSILVTGSGRLSKGKVAKAGHVTGCRTQ